MVFRVQYIRNFSYSELSSLFSSHPALFSGNFQTVESRNKVYFFAFNLTPNRKTDYSSNALSDSIYVENSHVFESECWL